MSRFEPILIERNIVQNYVELVQPRSIQFSVWLGCDQEAGLEHRKMYKSQLLFVKCSAASYPKSVATFRDSPHPDISMLFRVIAAFVSVALIPQGALAALTPADVVTNVGIVTKVSGNINSALSPITLTSSPDVITTAAQVSQRE